jgi:hypothetical protein
MRRGRWQEWLENDPLACSAITLSGHAKRNDLHSQTEGEVMD